MKLLYIPLTQSPDDIPWTLQKLGHSVTFYGGAQFDPNVPDNTQNEALRDYLADASFDALISYQFIPSVSDLCFARRIPYISWTYDSPLTALFTKSIYHPTNYTFIFDKMQCRRLQNLGAPHIYHLPLATNTDRTGALEITAEDEARYACDVSFVGHLYEKNTYNQCIAALPQKLQLELKLYIMQHLCRWDLPRPWPELSDECLSYMKESLHAPGNPWELLPDSMFWGITLLTRKLAEMERVTVLNALAARHKVDFYTSSSSGFLQNVTVHPPVDYHTDANKVFYLSKINLNLTLPSIESGVPLRVFDIMGCGGFMLTNRQEEIESLFVPGKEIETFRTMDELYEKVDYYLTHEKERLTIAMNGWKRVRESYSYEAPIQKMLSIALKGEDVR